MSGVVDQASGKDWTIYNGDSCEILQLLPDASIGFSIFSPPFGKRLYTYSNSPRDIGNSLSDDEFMGHFDFIVKQLRRVMRPGRIVAFHCMDLPTSKERDGVIGFYDFSGELIRAFEKHEFIMHGPRITIWKDPVTQMQRTKALGLLHKSVRENSAMCRAGAPDYLITMRCPGASERVTHTREEYPVDEWQKVASPVWMDINPSDTLQYRSAREDDDEMHICPLQLEVIRRGVKLWTNPGDVVLTPFAGIGSECFVAVEMGRKAIGIELKTSYYRQAVANMHMANAQGDLFAQLDAQ